MTRTQLALSVIAWLLAWAFWLAVTHAYHPTFALALIVTTSLIVVYAAAAYANHLVLIPKFWRAQRRVAYVAALLATMALLNAAALTIIRISYYNAVGPDADPNGTYIHYGIDFFGMSVHLAAAAIVVALWRKFRP